MVNQGVTNAVWVRHRLGTDCDAMVDVQVFRTEDAPDRVLDQARSLMDVAFDGDFGDDDWDHGLGGWHAVALDDEQVVSHAAVVARLIEVDGRPFRTGYVEAVATEPTRHGQGIGSLVMEEIGEVIRRDHELGALGTGRHAFYERLGWERWAGPTYVRTTGGGLARTHEDDDGVMVLRFGASDTIEVDSSISCEERAGDDW